MNDSYSKKDVVINSAYIGIVVILCLAAILFASTIKPFWFALVVATLLNPIIKTVNKKLKSRKTVSMIITLLFYLLIGTVLVVAIIETAYLMKDLFDTFPDYFESTVKPNLNNILSFLPGRFMINIEQLNLMNIIQKAVLSFSNQGTEFISNFLDSASSSLIGALVAIMLSYFISAQYDSVIEFLKAQLPDKLIQNANSIIDLLKNSVLKYIKATGILMIITFAELCVGFFVIDAENPVGMSVFIALFDALPIFGTGGIMLPWALFEIMESNYLFGIALLIIYVVVTVVRRIIEPKILGEQLGLNPIVALIAIYLGNKILGIAGMILLPIIMCILLTLHNEGKIKLYKEPDIVKQINQKEQNYESETN